MGRTKSAAMPTRQKILNAASKLMARKGFEHTNMSEIAHGAGVTEPTIYLHFEGKENLLLCAAEGHMAKYFLFLNEHLQGISGAHNKLRKLIWAHLRYSDMNREYMTLVLFDCRCNRNFYQSDAYRAIRKYAGILSSILDEGVLEKIFRSDMSLPLIRDIIFGLMDFEAIQFFVTEEKPDAASDLEDIMQLLDQMILRKYQAENQPVDKKQSVLHAAVEAFYEKGYSKATIADIARRADVADGTIYEYFKNKEDILLSIPEEHFKKYLEQLKQTFMGNDPQQKLMLFIQNHFQHYLDDPNFLVVFLTMIQFNRRFYKSRAYKIQYKYVIELEKLVEKIIKEGGIQNVNIRIFSNMFLGAFAHMTVRWFLVNHDRSFDKMREIKEVTLLLSQAISKNNSEM